MAELIWLLLAVAIRLATAGVTINTSLVTTRDRLCTRGPPAPLPLPSSPACSAACRWWAAPSAITRCWATIARSTIDNCRRTPSCSSA